MLVVESAVDAAVSPAFAWKFRTDIRTWNDPPAHFTLEGPFASGSSGATHIPGQPSLLR